jgi:hypothetical protein
VNKTKKLKLCTIVFRRICRKFCFWVVGKVSGLSGFDFLLEERVIDTLGWELVFKISELLSLLTALILCQPLKNKICDKYDVEILSETYVILTPSRRPRYQEKTLQTKFLRPLQVLMSLTLGWELVFKISELLSLFTSVGAAISPSILTSGQWVVVDNVYNCNKVIYIA